MLYLFGGFLIDELVCSPKGFKTAITFSLKDAFVKEVTLQRSTEQVNELETKGGFYTEEEMRTDFKYKPHLSLAIGIIVFHVPL